MNKTFTPPPADPEMLEVTLSKAVHLSEKLEEARAENQRLRQEIARLRAHNDAQHRSSETGTANYLAVCEENGTLREALEEISKGAGPFSRDPLTFASNTIEAMKGVAVAALAASAPEGEGHA